MAGVAPFDLHMSCVVAVLAPRKIRRTCGRLTVGVVGGFVVGLHFLAALLEDEVLEEDVFNHLFELLFSDVSHCFQMWLET